MLPKKHRLTTTYEFNKTRKLGEKLRTPLFDLFYWKPNDYEGVPRIGIVVTNKFSKIAPTRNRVKRIFREVFRNNIEGLKSNYWIVVHPSRKSEKSNYEEVNSELTKVLSKAPFAN